MTNEGGTAQKALILFVVPLVLYLCLLPALPLMEPDEGRYALIPQTMNATGDYITPHLKGVVYLEKPPLAYWATALAFKAFGEGEGSARLFPALCAWGCILLVYAMGVHFHDRKTGLYGAAVLTTMALPFALGRINILDMPLAFFIALSVWSGFLAFREARRIRKPMLYLMYAAAALAFLTKGLVGVVFPFAILVLWLLWRRRPGDVLRIFSPVGVILFLLLTGPWLYFVQKANPGFLHFFFVQEHFLRYTTTLHERTEPFYYYLPVLAGGILPWWPYLFQVVRSSRSGAIRLAPKPRFDRDEWSFCLIWAATVFLFFTLSSSKLASYMAPLCPPLAYLMGCLFREGTRHGEPAGIWRRLPGVLQALALGALVLAPLFIPEYIRIGQPHWVWLALPVAVQFAILVVPEWLRGKVTDGWFLSIYLLSALYLALILFPVAHYLGPGKSARDIASATVAHLPRGERLYQYQDCFYGLDFYLKSRMPVVGNQGELAFGIAKLDPTERRLHFPATTEFLEDIRQGAERYCLAEGAGHVAGLRAQIPQVRILWDNGKFYMLRLAGH